MKRPSLADAGMWALEVAVIAFWVWGAISAYYSRELFLLCLSCFALGERLARAVFSLRCARLERNRAEWESIAREAVARCGEQHAVFVEMGPPLEEIREYFERRVGATPKDKAN